MSPRPSGDAEPQTPKRPLLKCWQPHPRPHVLPPEQKVQRPHALVCLKVTSSSYTYSIVSLSDYLGSHLPHHHADRITEGRG